MESTIQQGAVVLKEEKPVELTKQFYIAPGDLRFSPKEVGCLKEIAWMVGNNPRATKRFVNIYRIIRAHELLTYSKEEMEEEFMAIMFSIALNIGRYSSYFKLFSDACAGKKDLPLKDILGTDIDQAAIKARLAESDQLKPLLEMKGESFDSYLRFVKRFTFRTDDFEMPVLRYQRKKKLGS